MLFSSFLLSFHLVYSTVPTDPVVKAVTSPSQTAATVQPTAPASIQADPLRHLTSEKLKRFDQIVSVVHKDVLWRLKESLTTNQFYTGKYDDQQSRLAALVEQLLNVVELDNLLKESPLKQSLIVLKNIAMKYKFGRLSNYFRIDLSEDLVQQGVISAHLKECFHAWMEWEEVEKQITISTSAPQLDLDDYNAMFEQLKNIAIFKRACEDFPLIMQKLNVIEKIIYGKHKTIERAIVEQAAATAWQVGRPMQVQPPRPSLQPVVSNPQIQQGPQPMKVIQSQPAAIPQPVSTPPPLPKTPAPIVSPQPIVPVAQQAAPLSVVSSPQAVASAQPAMAPTNQPPVNRVIPFVNHTCLLSGVVGFRIAKLNAILLNGDFSDILYKNDVGLISALHRIVNERQMNLDPLIKERLNSANEKVKKKKKARYSYFNAGLAFFLIREGSDLKKRQGILQGWLEWDGKNLGTMRYTLHPNQAGSGRRKKFKKEYRDEHVKLLQEVSNQISYQFPLVFDKLQMALTELRRGQ